MEEWERQEAREYLALIAAEAVLDDVQLKHDVHTALCQGIAGVLLGLWLLSSLVVYGPRYPRPVPPQLHQTHGGQ